MFDGGTQIPKLNLVTFDIVCPSFLPNCHVPAPIGPRGGFVVSTKKDMQILDESTLRTRAKRQGYALRKSRARNISADDLGEYMLVVDRKVVFLGGRFDASARLSPLRPAAKPFLAVRETIRKRRRPKRGAERLLSH